MMQSNATAVKWTEVNKKALIDAMMNEVMKGSFVDNGFKSASWKIIQAEFFNDERLYYIEEALSTRINYINGT